MVYVISEAPTTVTPFLNQLYESYPAVAVKVTASGLHKAITPSGLIAIERSIPSSTNPLQLSSITLSSQFLSIKIIRFTF